jgi:hypothetical protein
VKISTEVKAAVARERKRQTVEARADRADRMRRAKEDRERHARATRAAKTILKWAAEFALEAELPANGLQLSGSAQIYDDGALCIGYQRHGVGAMWHGHDPQKFADAPVDRLEELASLIQSGKIWDQIAALN